METRNCNILQKAEGPMVVFPIDNFWSYFRKELL